MKSPISIAHVVNPCVPSDGSDLHVAQPITFESMHRAQQAVKGRVQVVIYAAHFPADHSAVPDFMIRLPNLKRYVEHIGRNGNVRKLPLLKEILDGLYNQAEDADFLIYTNVDIALQPHFYLAIVEKIEQGYDAFVVNRRTISDRYTSPEQLEQMYPDQGRRHPGFDCFIFKREYYPHFLLRGIAIGIPPVGRLLLLNMGLLSNRFHLFKDEFLTFHVGNDRQWKTVVAVSQAEKNNRHRAFKHMVGLLWFGQGLRKKIFVLQGILDNFRYGSPWLQRLKRLTLKAIKTRMISKISNA